MPSTADGHKSKSVVNDSTPTNLHELYSPQSMFVFKYHDDSRMEKGELIFDDIFTC